uniref:Galectin n=1 Tax=Panagrellus redivivus TaxID=6233 RepID=A0A7E4UWU9_PANRE
MNRPVRDSINGFPFMPSGAVPCLAPLIILKLQRAFAGLCFSLVCTGCEVIRRPVNDGFRRSESNTPSILQEARGRKAKRREQIRIKLEEKNMSGIGHKQGWGDQNCCDDKGEMEKACARHVEFAKWQPLSQRDNMTVIFFWKFVIASKQRGKWVWIGVEVKPDYTIGLPVVFHNRPTDPGKFDDIIDVPDGFRKVKPIKFGASYDSQYQTYTFMVSHFRGKSLHFQHHEDIWAPSFRIYPTWFECDTYQLTLSFFDDNKCNVKIKSTNSAVEVWFGTHYAKQEKPDFLLHSPYVEMFVEEGELRVYIENAPTFYIGRFCPDYAHFVNEKTWLRIKMKRLRPTCDNGLALRVGRHVRWIEEIPIPGVVSLYNRTEDEYYDTDYDGNPVDSSTASFQPWYIAAGIAVLLVLLFGVTAFIGKRYIDRIPTQ